RPPTAPKDRGVSLPETPRGLLRLCQCPVHRRILGAVPGCGRMGEGTFGGGARRRGAGLRFRLARSYSHLLCHVDGAVGKGDGPHRAFCKQASVNPWQSTQPPLKGRLLLAIKYELMFSLWQNKDEFKLKQEDL